MSSCPVRNKISETGVAGPLAIARIILGLMLLWAFFDKLFGLGLSTPAGFGWIDGYSPTYYYMMNLEGWFSELFHWLAGAYQVCDVLITEILG